MEYAQYILECSKHDPAALLKSSQAASGSLKGKKSLDDKLLELYLEQSTKHEEGQNLDISSHLLGKLLKRERLNCLVLSLYPGNEGYSLMLRSRVGVESETMKLPYEESEVLDYIDVAELPPFLLDLLEKSPVNVFYSGCVIVEVRDYRRSAPGCYDSHYVLLRPSAQSLLCDVNSLAAEFGGGKWNQDDINQLESELLLQTSEPLCLDPSPAVAIVSTELTRQQKRFNEPSLRRTMKKHSQTALNRKRKMAQAPAPQELRLLDFLHKKRDKSKMVSKVLKSVDTWKQKPVASNVPDFESHSPDKLFKVMEHHGPTGDNLTVEEEHRLERDPNQEHRMLAVITVYRQPLADGYMGRLYLDHDYNGDDTILQGCSCQFPLGIRQNVDRYLDQFRDLFTEEGRRLVKITTSKPGQQDQVLYTAIPTPTPPSPVTITPVTSITITSAQALLKQATAIPVSMMSIQGDGTVSSLAAKRNIPIQLSLSIMPVSGTPTILPSAGSNQASMTLSAQTGQSQTSSQRLKQLSLHQRMTPSPMTSPASTPTSTPQQIVAFVSQQASLQKLASTPNTAPSLDTRTPTPTLHHSASITPTSVSARRTSLPVTVDGISGGQATRQTMQPTHNISFATRESIGSGGVNQGSNQGTQLSNINITSLNLQSLAGLPGVSLANLNLQPMQVSLSMPGGISVPVPITMISTNSSLLQNQAIMITSSSATGSSPAALVTMVTAIPATTTGPTSSTSTTGTMSSQQVVMSTGVGTSQTVLPTNSGMLSLPVSLSGLTQLMPVTTKTQGLRASAGSLPLLQLSGGQQSIQLLSLPQQQGRGQLKPGTLTAAITSAQQQANINRQGGGSSTAVPLSSVLTSQQISALTSLAVGKAGSGGTTALTASQFIQLTGTGAQGAAGSALPGTQGAGSALHTQLAFQKAPGGGVVGQTLQLHRLQFKQAPGPTLTPVMAAAAAASSESKAKKRGATTPPKS